MRCLWLLLILLSASLAGSGCADPFIEATTELQNTMNTTGPYVVQTIAVGVEIEDRIELLYRIDSDQEARFIPLLMDEADDDDGVSKGERFSASIPGQPAGTEIDYFVRLTRNGELVAEDPTDGVNRPFEFFVLP